MGYVIQTWDGQEWVPAGETESYRVFSTYGAALDHVRDVLEFDADDEIEEGMSIEQLEDGGATPNQEWWRIVEGGAA